MISHSLALPPTRVGWVEPLTRIAKGLGGCAKPQPPTLNFLGLRVMLGKMLEMDGDRIHDPNPHKKIGGLDLEPFRMEQFNI